VLLRNGTRIARRLARGRRNSGIKIKEIGMTSSQHIPNSNNAVKKSHQRKAKFASHRENCPSEENNSPALSSSGSEHGMLTALLINCRRAVY
jgi:hypothetical protein